MNPNTNNILPIRSFEQNENLFKNLKVGQVYKIVEREIKEWGTIWKPFAYLDQETGKYETIESGIIVLCLDNKLATPQTPQVWTPMIPVLIRFNSIEQCRFWNQAYPKFLVGDQTIWIHVSWLEKV